MNTPSATVRSYAGLLALSILFAIAQHRLLFLAFAGNVGALVEAARGVANGHPHWRLFQNRILGPYLFAALCRGRMSQAQAYAKLALALLIGFYGVLALCLRNLSGGFRPAFFGLCLALGLNAVLMQGLWIYPWDLIDLSIFTVFTWALMRRTRVWVLFAVALVELCNREVAVIMAVYLTLDGLISYYYTRARPYLTQAIVGGCLAVLGTVFVEKLRDALLIEEVGTERFQFHAGRSYNFVLFTNLREVLHSGAAVLVGNLPQYAVVAGIAVLAARQIRWQPRLGLFYGGLWVSVFCLGLLTEWRVWLEFVPFVTLAAMAGETGGPCEPSATLPGGVAPN